MFSPTLDWQSPPSFGTGPVVLTELSTPAKVYPIDEEDPREKEREREILSRMLPFFPASSSSVSSESKGADKKLFPVCPDSPDKTEPLGVESSFLPIPAQDDDAPKPGKMEVISDPAPAIDSSALDKMEMIDEEKKDDTDNIPDKKMETDCDDGQPTFERKDLVSSTSIESLSDERSSPIELIDAGGEVKADEFFKVVDDFWESQRALAETKAKLTSTSHSLAATEKELIAAKQTIIDMTASLTQLKKEHQIVIENLKKRKANCEAVSPKLKEARDKWSSAKRFA
jgi:hypothetical protein